MLHDRDSGRKQQRVRGTHAVARVVDVERVDADERRSRAGEVLRGRPRQVRMSLGVAGRAPVRVPSRPHQDRAAGEVMAREEIRGRARVRFPAASTTRPGKVRQPLERKRADVLAVRESVERGVEIRSGVRHHAHARDVERRAAGVVTARSLAPQEVGDHRSRKPRVRDHAVLDRRGTGRRDAPWAGEAIKRGARPQTADARLRQPSAVCRLPSAVCSAVTSLVRSRVSSTTGSAPCGTRHGTPTP